MFHHLSLVLNDHKRKYPLHALQYSSKTCHGILHIFLHIHETHSPNGLSAVEFSLRSIFMAYFNLVAVLFSPSPALAPSVVFFPQLFLFLCCTASVVFAKFEKPWYTLTMGFFSLFFFHPNFFFS